MPQNKKESLVYTVMMCFVMVLWMSIYNVSLHNGALNWESVQEGWLGFPIAYIAAMCCDWFIISALAKKFAFTYLVKPESSGLKKILAVSSSMVIPMVIIMSFYGGLEVCIRTGMWDQLLFIWLLNIPKNFIMALPLQLIIAGPAVRYVFRKVFPIGTIQAS